MMSVLMVFSCATGGIAKPDSPDSKQPAAAPQADNGTKPENAAKQPGSTSNNRQDSNTASKPNAGVPPSNGQYTPLAQAVLAELNFVRTDPKRYANEVLGPRRQYFKGKLYSEPGTIPLETQEGITPLNECIQALYTAPAVGSLALEPGLCRSAQWLADDQSRTGALGHTGSDNSAPAARMNRYGTWGITCGENCAYGSHTAREIVAQLLIDDGVPNRGHRINILQQAFTKIGFGFSDKNKAPYGAVSVMDFAGSYESN